MILSAFIAEQPIRGSRQIRFPAGDGRARQGQTLLAQKDQHVAEGRIIEPAAKLERTHLATRLGFEGSAP